MRRDRLWAFTRLLSEVDDRTHTGLAADGDRPAGRATP